MEKIKILFFALSAALLIASCDSTPELGQFEADESLMQEYRTDGPMAPGQLTASFDDFCDKVELSWTPSVRTSTYDVYKDGALLAQGLTEPAYIDSEAQTIATEYWVYAVNAHGNSLDSASATGRMATTPSEPLNFSATDSEYEAKVDLTWDAADFAKFYRVSRGTTVLSDSVVGNAFSDNTNAPQEETEYSIVAVGVCGESAAVTDMGKADSMMKYSIIINENFDGLDVGYDMSTNEMFSYRFNYNALGGPGTLTVTDEVSGTKCLKAIHDDPATTASAKSTQIVLENFNLLVGQRYRISFKIKSAGNSSLHIAVDSDNDGIPSKNDTQDSYLLPTSVNDKNGNLMGIKIEGADEWKTFSYEFPTTGTGSQDWDVDPSTTDWVAATIQPGQENPKIMIAQWIAKTATAPGILIDDLIIELIK